MSSDDEVKSREKKRPTSSLVIAADMAAMLGCAKSTLYDLAKQRKIPCVRIGDRVLFDPAKVIAALTIPAETDGTGDRPLVVRTEGRQKPRKIAANE